ncbi:GntR family transcriptional regulator [Aurantiacibacter hainanensis]|uniref:GntR family transcriptional regulator n=1 Tax=Aurantiacibacter hainanensis TaxID=3076114 RepID=UPI0030C6FD21
MDEIAKALPASGPPAAEIADWIRSQIRANRFVPGQRLVEVDIIRRTGGSRSKVREAFQRLAAEGLLEIEEFRGASVREASLEEVSQLYRARAALEGICAADFTRLATDEDKERLREITERMEACVESGAAEQFGKLNSEWHTMIMRVTGNDVIADLVSRLNTPVHHLLFESFYRGDRMNEATQDHRAILNAIMEGNAEAAEKAMRTHVENGLRFLRSLDKALFGT